MEEIPSIYFKTFKNNKMITIEEIIKVLNCTEEHAKLVIEIGKRSITYGKFFN